MGRGFRKNSGSLDSQAAQKEQNCAACELLFTAISKYGTQKFCSDFCTSQFRYDVETNALSTERICGNCCTAFVVVRNGQGCCGKVCAQLFVPTASKKTRLPKRCAYEKCKKLFISSGRRDQKFCNKKCHKDHERNLDPEKTRARGRLSSRRQRKNNPKSTKAAAKKWRASEKGRISVARYLASDKRKAVSVIYKNSTKGREGTARRVARNVEIVRPYREQPCVDCGRLLKPYQMDFDHLRDKYEQITTLVATGASEDTLHAELAKCETVCVHCHKERTQRRYEAAYGAAPKEGDDLSGLSAKQKRRVRNRAFIQGEKNVPCADCGETFPYYIMEFDHVRGKKLVTVGRLTEAPRAKIIAEIAKCEVVCAACHRERTQERMAETIQMIKDNRAKKKQSMPDTEVLMLEAELKAIDEEEERLEEPDL